MKNSLKVVLSLLVLSTQAAFATYFNKKCHHLNLVEFHEKRESYLQNYKQKNEIDSNMSLYLAKCHNFVFYLSSH